MAIYNEEALCRLTERLDELMREKGGAGFALWRKMDALLGQAALETLGEKVELEELFEEWKQEEARRCMRVDRVHFSEDGGPFPDEMNGKDGYELLLENEDGSYSWTMRADCKIIDGVGYIPAGMLEKMLEMAWQGFRLVEAKAWERKTIGRGDCK